MSDGSDPANWTNRRRFLKSTAALAGAGLAAGCTGDGGGGTPSPRVETRIVTEGGETVVKTVKVTQSPTPGLNTFTNEAGVKVGADYDAVQELAANEGSMTVYATIDREPFGVWMESFREKHPEVNVNHITGGSEDLISRWTSEYKSDNVAASIYISTSKIQRTWQNGQVMSLEPEYFPSIGEAPDKFKSPDNEWIATRQVLGNIFFNTDTVSESDASTWMDIVTDDRWADQNIGWDPTPNMFLMSWLRETQGREFFENLRDQRPRFVDSHTDLARFVGAGEFPVSFTYTHKMGRFGNELPVSYFPFDPTPAVISPAVINNKSPEPNSALLFLNWLTSAEGQQVLGSTQYIPWHPNAEYTGFPGVYPSDEYEVDTILPTADIEGTRQMWDEVMGDLVGG